MESEGRKPACGGQDKNPDRSNKPAEGGQANQRWLSASTIRHSNGEVSYTTTSFAILRGSVLKEAEDAGSDYGRYGWEADDMTAGDLVKSIMREGGAKAGTEMIVS